MNIVTLPNHIFLEEVRLQLQAGHTVTFRVRGWSMRPFLESARDKVLLLPPRERPVRLGDAALVLTDDHRYVLHRVIHIDAEGRCTLWGDGNVYGRETCSADNVIGVAKGFFIGRRERFVSVDGRLWRSYSWLWMHTTLLRRPLLLAYRIIFKTTKLLTHK